MSVLFLECPEEFPELVELWRKSFAETATAHPTSEAPLRTTPLNIDVIDCDDPRYDLQGGFTKAVVPTQTTPSGYERGLNSYKPLKSLHNFTQKHYTCK